MVVIAGDAFGTGPPDNKAPPAVREKNGQPDGRDAYLRDAFTALVKSTSSLGDYDVVFGMAPYAKYSEGVCSNCGETKQVKRIPLWATENSNINGPNYSYECEMRRLDRQNARTGKPLVAFLVHKHNVDDCTACLCPGCVTNVAWQVVLEDTTWAVSDAKFDFNRAQTHDVARDRMNNEMARVAGVVAQLKSKFDDDERALGQKTAVAATVMEERDEDPVAAEPVAVPVPAGGGVVQKLKDLSALKDAGALSSAEFEAAKAKVLAA